jgi:hypothetical protein
MRSERLLVAPATMHAAAAAAAAAARSAHMQGSLEEG